MKRQAAKHEVERLATELAGPAWETRYLGVKHVMQAATGLPQRHRSHTLAPPLLPGPSV